MTLREPEYIYNCKMLYIILLAIFEYKQAAFSLPLLREGRQEFRRYLVALENQTILIFAGHFHIPKMPSPLE